MNNLKANMMMLSANFSKTKTLDLDTSFKSLNKMRIPVNIQRLSAYLIVLSVFLSIMFTATDSLSYDLVVSEYKMLIEALITTLLVSIVTLVTSIITGFGFYLAMNSKNEFLKTFTNILKEIVMGTPLLVMIFLVVYVFGIKVGINQKIILGTIALALYMTPYIANSYETASAVVGEDQHTVMELYHFTLWQRYRYIIIPQMIKPLIPSMINNLSSIIKGSALLKMVSVSEISYVITVISNKNYASIEGYLVMWIMYLVITIPLSLLASYMGRRYGSAN